MYVCVCNAVTDRDIREAVEQGFDSMSALRRELKVGTCCGRCTDSARNLLSEAVSEQWLPQPSIAALAWSR